MRWQIYASRLVLHDFPCRQSERITTDESGCDCRELRPDHQENVSDSINTKMRLQRLIAQEENEEEKLKQLTAEIQNLEKLREGACCQSQEDRRTIPRRS